MKQAIIYTDNLTDDLGRLVGQLQPDSVFVLTDSQTSQHCWPLLSACQCMQTATLITIPHTDSNKSLQSLSHVWSALQQGGATRHSLLVNLGGGMVTDLGGFAAATFKRGLRFINVPTTLLAMVDASVGGKTGINFGGLKNEVGAFCEAQSVVVDTAFLLTLPVEEVLSGYAEMLKHSLLADEQMWARHLTFPLDEQPFSAAALQTLQQMVRESIGVKSRVVEADPREQGLRKSLNLGHTFGHAFESWSFSQEQPLLHGYAVAHGLVCELYLSAVKKGFPTDKMRQTIRFIHQYYGRVGFTCDDYDTLVALMHHDKKNRGNQVQAALLSNIGDVSVGETLTDDEIREALDFCRDGA